MANPSRTSLYEQQYQAALELSDLGDRDACVEELEKQLR